MNVCRVTSLDFFCLFIVLAGSLLAVKLLHCYCVEVLRIRKSDMIGNVKFCVKDIIWVFQPGGIN